MLVSERSLAMLLPVCLEVVTALTDAERDYVVWRTRSSNPS
jgi:hypothetical protein